MPQAAKYLIAAGLLLLAAGLAWWLFPNFFGRLGKLPGDIRVENAGGGFYFPVVTCILLSIVLSLIFWLARKFL